ncbi:MAG: 23S rRNA (guanosine(2251)-2'-O)-methyltransferase RlmB [Calditerrivibrio sp.]|nr:23S rRNA (guanosine(2251)-2'-O)-methyltransferase RlmB [Calditerrivibrio sp.]
MIFYGKNPFYEALNAKKIKKAYIRKDDKVKQLLQGNGIPFEELDHQKHRDRFGKDAQGYAFEFDIELVDIEHIASRGLPICILDHIQDPHNFGAIIRAGHCFGINSFMFAKDNQSPITPVVVKSSAGAVVHCSFCEVVNIGRAIEYLKEHGYWIYAADISGDITLEEIVPNIPFGIIIGNEGDGVRKNILKKSDIIFKIPMRAKIDSLNASQSAAVAFYHFFIKSS